MSVHLDKSTGKWFIRFNKTRIGDYDTKEQAIARQEEYRRNTGIFRSMMKARRRRKQQFQVESGGLFMGKG